MAHIVMMAGGTGGHVFPALAAAQELVARPASRNVIIALFDAEEPPAFQTGAMGSTRFFEDHEWRLAGQGRDASPLDLSREACLERAGRLLVGADCRELLLARAEIGDLVLDLRHRFRQPKGTALGQAS